MRESPLEQVAAICGKFPANEKIVLVPSWQVGYDFSTGLARSGYSWANAHFFSPLDYAAKVAEPVLFASDRSALPEDGRLLLVAGLLAKLLNRPNGYFTGLTPSPGVVRAFASTIASLRMADLNLAGPVGEFGLDVSREEAGTGTPSAGKVRPVLELLEAYVNALASHRWYDAAGVFDEATRAVQGTRADGRIVAVLDETILSHREAAFVGSIPASHYFRVGGSRPEATPRSAAAQLKYRYVFDGDKNDHGDSDRPGNLTQPISSDDTNNDPSSAAPPKRTGPAAIGFRRAYGVETEVRGVLREIKQRRLPLDEVEVAYTSEVPYASMLLDLAGQLDLPATFAHGIPALLTVPGRAMLGFHRWIAEGFDGSVLAEIAEARLIRFPIGGSGAKERADGGRSKADPDAGDSVDAKDRPRPYELARFLTRWQVGAGFDEYDTALIRERRRIEQQRGGIDRALKRIELVDAAIASLRKLVAPIVDPVAGSDPTAAIARAAIGFLDKYVRIEGDLSVVARDSLRSRLEHFATECDRLSPPEAAHYLLADLIKQHHVRISASLPGAIHVTSIERAGYSGRANVFVVGLDEQTFPGPALQDPVLLDVERSRLSETIALLQGRAQERVFQLERLLASAASEVVLVWNRYNMLDGSQVYPAAAVKQLLVRTGSDDETKIPIYERVVQPESELSDTWSLVAQRDADGYGDAVAGKYTWLADGAVATAARSSADMTAYDGFVGRPTPELALRNTDLTVSASRIETLAKCPYQYFLKHVLNVRAIDPEVPAPGRWLSRLAFGRVLHAVFEQFMTQVRDAGERVEVERHRPVIRELLRLRIDEQREETPPRNDLTLMADEASLEKATDVFLAAEEGRDVEPYAFELQFGQYAEKRLDQSVNSGAESVAIELSPETKIKLQGSIDRVDRSPTGFELWDYKTGKMRYFREDDMLEGGTRLQWVLYAYALEEILRSRNQSGSIVKSGYFFTSDTEHGMRIGRVPPAKNELESVLRPLFEMVEEGGFFHVQKKDNACVLCRYKGVCENERQTVISPELMFAPGNAAVPHANRWLIDG